MWVRLPVLDLEVEIRPETIGGQTRLHCVGFRGEDGKRYSNVLRALTRHSYTQMEEAVEIACKLCEIVVPVIAPRPFDLDPARPRLSKRLPPEPEPEEPPMKRPRIGDAKKKKFTRK